MLPTLWWATEGSRLVRKEPTWLDGEARGKRTHGGVAPDDVQDMIRKY